MIEELVSKFQKGIKLSNGIDAVYEVIRTLVVCHGLATIRIEVKRAFDKRDKFPYSWSLFIMEREERTWKESVEVAGTAENTEDLALEKALAYILKNY